MIVWVVLGPKVLTNQEPEVTGFKDEGDKVFWKYHMFLLCLKLFEVVWRNFGKWFDCYSPVCVLMCLLSKEGLSKALLQTPQGRSVLSLGLARGVGTAVSGRSPCELAAELSPDTDFLSSSADGGDPVKALERRDIERSNGESGNMTCNWIIFR